jgi:hypothetical protein
VLDGRAPTIKAAAMRCGSSVPYVRAAIALLRSENTSLITSVMHGDVPLLAAARGVGQLASLVAAYRQASAADRVAFAKVIGPSTLFENSLVPTFL